MPEAVATAVETAVEILGELETLLRGLSDVDLHRAHPDGGYTIAEVVTHIHLSGMLSMPLRSECATGLAASTCFVRRSATMPSAPHPRHPPRLPTA